MKFASHLILGKHTGQKKIGQRKNPTNNARSGKKLFALW
jgi:hypothetical protein